jgi:hypothetical protein
MTRQAERRKFHYIYKITRIDTGRFYIGMHSTDDLEDGYFGSGKIITASIKKHGKEKHVKQILEFLPSREALKLREKELVNEELLGDKLCMNLKLGGEGGGGFTKEAQQKGSAAGNLAFLKKLAEDDSLRNACVERGKLNKGRKHTITARENMAKARAISKSWVGRKHSQDTKQKMSLAHSGKHNGPKNSQYGTCWVIKDQPMKIRVDELDKYLSEGYSRGRKKK